MKICSEHFQYIGYILHQEDEFSKLKLSIYLKINSCADQMSPRWYMEGDGSKERFMKFFKRYRGYFESEDSIFCDKTQLKNFLMWANLLSDEDPSIVSSI